MYDIRRATLDDAQEIAKIHVECWEECYSYLPGRMVKQRNYRFRLDQWLKTLGREVNGRETTLVLTERGFVVGFAHAKVNVDPDMPQAKSEFHACYFRQEFRRTAAGPMMLAALIRWSLAEQLTPFCVWTWKQNPIRCTYRALGLTPLVHRERTIGESRAWEVGFIADDVERCALRVDRMISRVAYRAGASESQLLPRRQTYPTVLRADKDQQSGLQ